jgi:hypothetical protein
MLVCWSVAVFGAENEGAGKLRASFLSLAAEHSGFRVVSLNDACCDAPLRADEAITHPNCAVVEGTFEEAGAGDGTLLRSALLD